MLTVQQVPDLLHVDLKVGDLDVHLHTGVHTVEVVKHVPHDAGDDAVQLRVLQLSLHSTDGQGGEG